LTFRNDLIKLPTNDLNVRFEESKHNQNQSIDNSQAQSNFNNVTSSALPVTARDPMMRANGKEIMNRGGPSHHKTNTFSMANQNINENVPDMSEYSSDHFNQHLS